MRNTEKVKKKVRDKNTGLSKDMELIEKILSSINIPLAYMDKYFNFIRVNRSFVEVNGRSPKFYIGKNYFSLFPNKTNEAIFRKVIAVGKPYFIHEKPFKYIKHPEQGVIYRDWSLHPLKEQDGKVIGVVLVLTDVSKHKQTEDVLRGQETILRTILETLPVGVWVLDKHGKIIHGNQEGFDIWAGARYVGIDQFSKYKGWWLDTGKKIKAEEWASARAIRKGETSLNEEIEIEAFDGKHKFILNSAIPIKNENQDIIGAFIVNQDITKRKLIENALRESEKQCRDLSCQIIAAQEIERKRISRELHDELGQALSLIKLKLRYIKRNLSDNQLYPKQECEDTLQFINQVIENVRRLSKDLSPSILDDLGITAALLWLIKTFIKRNKGIHVTYRIMKIDDIFPENVQINLYRIIQEALTNIEKHASAKKVSVIVKKYRHKVSFSIKDDGRGFKAREDRMKTLLKKGLGLVSMNERVRILKGVIDIKSEREKGTQVKFILPINRKISNEHS